MFRILLISCIIVAINGAKFPSNFQRCKISDEACILKTGNEIMKMGKKGFVEIGLPVFEPLSINRIGINQGGNGPVVLKIDLTNVFINGFSGVKFTSIKGLGKNIDKAKIDLKYKQHLFEIQGPYKANGKVLVLPVQGDGIANITLLDLDSHVKLLTKKIVKNGKEYMQVDKIRFNFELNEAKLDFTNLFNGNVELSNTFNKFLTENWREIINELKPAMADSIAAVFKSMLNNVFGNIPYDEFFIE